MYTFFFLGAFRLDFFRFPMTLVCATRCVVVAVAEWR
jgi:hypothetical protein